MDVLLVEDEPLVRELVCDGLIDAGLQVVAAANADEALRAVDHHGAPPAVLLADLNLGPGMSGPALANEARRRWPQVGIMFMTGEERHLACVRSEFREGWFPKPFSPTRLVAAVRARMQMQRAALLEATPAHV